MTYVSVREKISPYIRQTPLVHSMRLSERFKANVYLKMEHLQRGGSIKIRGGYSKILSDTSNKHFVTASSGNHGISFSMAARSLGCTVDVFVPVTTSRIKRSTITDFGAHLILSGNSWDQANEAAQEHAKKSGGTYVHPFDDDNVIAGYSTAGEEVAAELDQIDVMLCSIGGGGIISGMTKAVKHFNTAARVYGVETYGAHSMRLSMEAGFPTTINELTSAAKSLGIKTPPQKMFDFIRKNISGLAMVSDQDAQKARQGFWNERQEVIELAASCSLAALENGLIPDIEDKNVVVLICGGTDSRDNLDKEFIPVDVQTPFYTLG